MKLLFVAGPYRSNTIRGIVKNIRKAEKVALKYWRKGYVVICPHKNTSLLDGAATDEVWLNGGLEILKRCDGIVMMKGWEKSSGSIAELKLAKELKLEIIYEKSNINRTNTN